MVLHKEVDLVHSFYLRDGRRLASLEELAKELDTISNELFNFHTKEHGNDFAKWINDLFEEPELMRAVRRCLTAKETAAVIRQALQQNKESPIKSPSESSSQSPSLESSKINTPIIPEIPIKSSSDTEAAFEKAAIAEKNTITNNVVDKKINEPVVEKKPVEELNISKDWNDENFAPIRREMTEKNEKLSEKYDNVIKHMQVIANDPIPKELTELSEKLNNRYLEILAKLSEHRRAGKDMLFPTLVAKQFPAKLTLAKATRQKFDFAVAEQVLAQVEFEVLEILNAKELNVKQEIEEMAALRDIPFSNITKKSDVLASNAATKNYTR